MKSETITSEQFYSSNRNSSTGELTINSSIFNAKSNSVKKDLKKPSNPVASLVLAGTFLLMFVGTYFVIQLQDEFDQFQLERINSS